MKRIASRPLPTTLLALIVGVLALAAGHLGASAEHLEHEGPTTATAAEDVAFNDASSDDLPPAADLPLAELPAAVDDDDDADAFVENEVTDFIDDVVPTNPNAPACANGLAPVLYQGVPVTNNDGSPVCVTPDGDGQPGEATPGQAGESGQASDSEGVVDPGGAGENPNA